MADENTPNLQDRLSTFSQKNKTKRRGGNIGVGALAIALALGGGGAAYLLATNMQEDRTLKRSRTNALATAAG